MSKQLWLELPPISPDAPPRLLVFLHGAGSTPEAFAPVAIAWQLKFPGATAVILQGLRPSLRHAGHDWFDPTARGDARTEQVSEATQRVAERIAGLQKATGIAAGQTCLIGFSQGATIALELARCAERPASVVVSYAGRLARPIRDDERIDATVHLVHGEFDSVVPPVYAQQALRGLRAVGVDATLDVVENGSHSIGQDMVIVGTTRLLQTIFRGRRRPPSGAVAGMQGRMLH